MELLSERVGFKRICWSNGISIGIPKLVQHVDCGIDWQAIGKNPNNYLHVFTLYGKNVPKMILNSTLPRVTISSSSDETMKNLSLYGRHTTSKGVEKFWNTNWSLDGSITENKAVITVPYIYDEYGMVKPEYEEFGHAIVDKMSEFFL